MTTKTSTNNVVRKEMMSKEYCQKYPKRKCHENAKGKKKTTKRKYHETFLGNESPGNNIYDNKASFPCIPFQTCPCSDTKWQSQAGLMQERREVLVYFWP